jgi:hypothetical protein
MTQYLEPSTIERSVLESGLDDQHRYALLGAAARITASARLTELVDAAHRAIYHKQPSREGLRAEIEAAYAGNADEVWGVIALDSVRLVRERAEARRIPQWSYSQLHWRHALYLLNEYRRKQGAAGAVRHDYLSWFSIVASGELCRVGILEFAITTSRFNVVAYRRAKIRRRWLPSRRTDVGSYARRRRHRRYRLSHRSRRLRAAQRRAPAG